LARDCDAGALVTEKGVDSAGETNPVTLRDDPDVLVIVT
jgi:hypothetical protein